MPAWVVPAAIAAGGAIINAFQGWRAKKANEGYIRQQNAYNAPQSQMQRYQAARLNPNLIYSQGNPGNQSQTMTQPESLQNAGSEIASSYNSSSLAQSQVATQSVTRDAVRAKTVVSKLQAAVLAQNPYLDADYLNAVVRSMMATATEKEANARVSGAKADWFTGEKSFNVDGVQMHGPAGALKMETELKTLLQNYELGGSDMKIKAEVIESKAFQNDLLEIQKRWMQDGEITPQHIYQGIMMFLKSLITGTKVVIPGSSSPKKVK